MGIQWFPGHMTSARKKAAETMERIDVVIEVLEERKNRAYETYGPYRTYKESILRLGYDE